MEQYTSKYYDGFEIRFYVLDNDIIGRLFKDKKPVEIIDKKGGKAIHMETGNKTTIIRKLRHVIAKFNSGQAEIKEVESIKGNKFTDGDILIEKDTNVVDLSEVVYIYSAGSPYSEQYILLSFQEFKPIDEYPDLDEEIYIRKFTANKSDIDNNYISIGNDLFISDCYSEINNFRNNISKIQDGIISTIESGLKMLNKTNEDFYNDLIININKSDASEYEKKKYIEFVEAAYLNREES